MRIIDADDFENRMYHEAFEKDSDLQKWDSGCWIRYKLFENVLREQPTAQSEPQWTLCRKKLPDEKRNYLVQALMNDDIFVAKWQGDYWNVKTPIIAWMPLPKPFVLFKKGVNMDNSSTKLKSCPFCGGNAVIFKYLWQVRCEECMVKTSVFETREEAIEAWNRRVKTE